MNVIFSQTPFDSLLEALFISFFTFTFVLFAASIPAVIYRARRREIGTGFRRIARVALIIALVSLGLATAGFVEELARRRLDEVVDGNYFHTFMGWLIGTSILTALAWAYVGSAKIRPGVKSLKDELKIQ